MPFPQTEGARLRPALSQPFMEWMPTAANFGMIGLNVLPSVEVPEQAGQVDTIPVESLLRDYPTGLARGGTGGYARGDFEYDKTTYNTEEYGFEVPVSRRMRQQTRNHFDAEQLAADIARWTIMVQHEKRVAAAVFNATTWNGAALTTAITHEWDDAANATPIINVNAARNKVYDNSGMWPNALIVNRKVYHNLKMCDAVQAAIAASGAGDSNMQGRITARMLAEVFDLEMVLVAGGTKNTADEGQDAALSGIWSDEYAMVCRIAMQGDNIMTPCVGRTMHWPEDDSEVTGLVESYWSDETRSDVVRVRHDVDEVILRAQHGHLLSNVTT